MSKAIFATVLNAMLNREEGNHAINFLRHTARTTAHAAVVELIEAGILKKAEVKAGMSGSLATFLKENITDESVTYVNRYGEVKPFKAVLGSRAQWMVRCYNQQESLDHGKETYMTYSKKNGHVEKNVTNLPHDLHIAQSSLNDHSKSLGDFLKLKLRKAA